MKKALVTIGLLYLGYKLLYPDETVVIIDENQLPDPRTPGTVYQQLPGGGFGPVSNQPITNN